jgi:hypothetical protein
MNKIRTYIKNIYLAFTGKPVTVEVDKVLIVPFTKSQVAHLENVFKLPVYKEGMSLTEMAKDTGKYEVVEFIKAWSARGGRV